MTWEEFKELNNPLFSMSDGKELTDIECPKCGNFIYRYTQMIFTTYPPQYHYECPNCGWNGSWFNLTN